MTRVSWYKKGLVAGIIVLFIGITIIPVKTAEINSFEASHKNVTNNGSMSYIIFDDFEDYNVGEPPKISKGWSTEGMNSNQYIEARIDPLDANNMVMLIKNSGEDNIWCRLVLHDFAPPGRYVFHYRIYTPQLSSVKTIYENYFDEFHGNEYLVVIHRNEDQIKWGGDSYCGGYYDFDPPIVPSKSRWITEEIYISPEEFRILHDNSINASGGFCNEPVGGASTWWISGHKSRDQMFYIDDFWISCDSQPPDTPQKPTGQTSGTAGNEYTYTTYANDPDDDQVLYQWKWGDGTYSDWLGPFNSGELASATNSWFVGSYSIRVKAKDIYNIESDWSAPLTINMPRNKIQMETLLQRLFERYLLYNLLLQKLH